MKRRAGRWPPDPGRLLYPKTSPTSKPDQHRPFALWVILERGGGRRGVGSRVHRVSRRRDGPGQAAGGSRRCPEKPSGCPAGALAPRLAPASPPFRPMPAAHAARRHHFRVPLLQPREEFPRPLEVPQLLDILPGKQVAKLRPSSGAKRFPTPAHHICPHQLRNNALASW